jgi:FkbH-like protein
VPAIVALDSTDPAAWTALGRLFRMPNTRETEEARTRKQLYQQQAQRQQTVRAGADYPALMRTLGLRANIGLARESDLDRVAELVQRTNQFNTTTIRYQKHELAALVGAGDGRLVVGELADKFGALGLVCVVVVRLSEAEAVLENFVMSCRAMGFGMERSMLAAAISHAGGRPVVGRFIPSGRNQPAEGLFANAGFKEEGGLWKLPEGEAITAPEWISVVQR